jgi:hypothetical protein
MVSEPGGLEFESRSRIFRCAYLFPPIEVRARVAKISGGEALADTQ